MVWGSSVRDHRRLFGFNYVNIIVAESAPVVVIDLHFLMLRVLEALLLLIGKGIQFVLCRLYP